MCGIAGVVASRSAAPVLMEGLKLMEYRGYDSAGMAVLDHATGDLQCTKTVGKVATLAEAVAATPLRGQMGIAHTRWATHGKPTQANAHPHLSHGRIALVHNGIIENDGALRTRLTQKGYVFTSQTDTEVIVHLLHAQCQSYTDLLEAVRVTVALLKGHFSLCILHADYPDRLIAVQAGSPLVVGVGVEENFVASDQLALTPVTQQFIALKKGEFAQLTTTNVAIYDAAGTPLERSPHLAQCVYESLDRGTYRHYMQKEMFEQPDVVRRLLERNGQGKTLSIADLATPEATALLSRVKHLHIVACGTSYHAGLVARYWVEKYVGIPCSVEVASEWRYRDSVVRANSLFLTLSQSGETADTLAALNKAKQCGYLTTMTLCNKAESALVRESQWAIMTQAGPEIGVASTKAYVAQLVVLLLFVFVLRKAQKHGGYTVPTLPPTEEAAILKALIALPYHIECVLEHSAQIKRIAKHIFDKQHVLFLGKGVHYPIALEGALKLTELAYIHAQGYTAGELKHGPLALVDENMPVVVLMPSGALLEKMMSTVSEVRARDGCTLLLVETGMCSELTLTMPHVTLPRVHESVSPILHVVALQLLAYHSAVHKGTDVDQPRNLAKSVTVE